MMERVHAEENIKVLFIPKQILSFHALTLEIPTLSKLFISAIGGVKYFRTGITSRRKNRIASTEDEK